MMDLVMIGDSVTVGQGTGTNVVNVPKMDGAFNLSPTAYMQAGIIAKGVPATKAEWSSHATAAQGGYTIQQALTAYNPRVDYANWSPSTPFSQNATSTPFKYTPASGEAADTWEWIDLGTGGQTWSATIAGAAPAITSSVTAYNDTLRRTYSASSATTGQFAIALTGGAGYFYGVRSWNSNIKSVNLLNYAFLGFQAAQLANSTGTFGVLDQVIATGTKTVLINLGENDSFFTSNPAVDSIAFGNNIENYTGILQAQGITVILVFPHRRNDVTLATMQMFQTEAKRAAVNKNVVLIDFLQYFGNIVNPAFMDDDVHLNAAGSAQVGAVYAEFWAHAITPYVAATDNSQFDNFAVNDNEDYSQWSKYG